MPDYACLCTRRYKEAAIRDTHTHTHIHTHTHTLSQNGHASALVRALLHCLPRDVVTIAMAYLEATGHMAYALQGQLINSDLGPSLEQEPMIDTPELPKYTGL